MVLLKRLRFLLGISSICLIQGQSTLYRQSDITQCVCNVGCSYQPGIAETSATKEDVSVVSRDVRRLENLLKDFLNKSYEGPQNNPIISEERQQINVLSVQAWSEGGCCVFEHDKPNLFFINHEAVPVARSRGFNMVTIDGKSGALIAAAVFDTYGSSTAEYAMAGFIEGTPEGSVVMATIFDSAEIHCKTTCKNRLKSVGAERGTFEHRSSYALLGYKRKSGETVFPPWVKEKYAAYPGKSGRGGLQSPALSVSANITLGF